MPTVYTDTWYLQRAPHGHTIAGVPQGTITSTHGYPDAHMLTLNVFADLTHHAQANPHWTQGPVLKAQLGLPFALKFW